MGAYSAMTMSESFCDELSERCHRASFRRFEERPSRLRRCRQAAVCKGLGFGVRFQGLVFIGQLKNAAFHRGYQARRFELRCCRYKLDSSVLPWALHDGKRKGSDEVVSVFVLDVAAGDTAR